jgi:methionine aminopeptidase
MRSAARIVENMHARIYEIIEPGLAKNQLAAEIFHSGIAGKDEHWGDYPAILPLLPTGMDATAAHLTWDDSKLKPGDITFFEIAGCHRRYHCPLSRTISLGKPPQKYLDAEKAVLEIPRCRKGRARRDACRTRQRQARAAKTSPSRFSTPWKSTASRRKTAPATRSACLTRLTGASAPSACGAAIKPSCSRT